MTSSFHSPGGFIQPIREDNHMEPHVYYRVKLNGEFITGVVPTTEMAANKISTLPPDQQILAEVVKVTKDGKEILLG